MVKVQRIIVPNTRERSWVLFDAEHQPLIASNQYLSYLHHLGRSPNTVRAYAHHLQAFSKFLAEEGRDWTTLGLTELAKFVTWLRRVSSPNPLGSSQCLPRIRKACWPMQGQSSLFPLALQSGIHRAIARPSWNAAERNVGMGLECQLIDLKSVADEDCVSLLSDIAERAEEVVPVQHCARIIRESPMVGLVHILCRRGLKSIVSQTVRSPMPLRSSVGV
jgi:hypothetical protein